jgi:hypothetical protein
MDHHYIEEQNIPDRYLTGNLPAEERARFEEHFIDCRECLDRLETTEDFLGALRDVAVEDASRGYARAGLLARILGIARLSRARRPALLLGAILLLAALSTALWIKERGRARDDLAQFTSVELQRQYEESRQRSERLERELQESQRQSAEQRRQFETQLERARLAGELEKLRRARAAPPAFILSITRGGRSEQPINRITVPRSASRIILSPELEPDPDLQSYRATLQTTDNRRIWSESNLRLNSKYALNLNLSASLFQPGDYLLTLEGFTQQGHYAPVGKYLFQVIKH